MGKRVVILGATRGMGRALARLLVERGDQLCILGRNAEQLERSAADLSVRGGAEVASVECDLEQAESLEPALARAWDQLGGVDLVVVTAAAFGTQDQLAEDTERARRLCTINFAHTLAFCEYARKRLLEQGGGTLAVFSSVAGDRGRKPGIIYGASKAGLSAYLEGLDHRYRSEGLVTVCVKPGFVKTGMTEGLEPPPFAGEPQQVARDVLRGIERQRPVVYTPWIWGWVMFVIKRLPRAVMRRIGF